MNDSKSAFFCSFDRVVITGASSGIGAALLRQLATLLPDGRFCNFSRSSAAISSLGDRLRSVPCDLADPQGAAAAVASARDWLAENDRGGCILLINNSGFGGYGIFPAPDPKHNADMIAVNTSAPVQLTAGLADLLRKSGGAVVNIASTASFQPTPFLATYGATKAFLLHWSLALAEEWRKEGVRVLAVCPGPTETSFFRAAGFSEAPLKGGGQTADQVATITLRALGRKKALVTCGTGNRILAALASKLPKVCVTRLTAMLLRRMRLEQFQRK